jgi:hypothetical protein
MDKNVTKRNNCSLGYYSITLVLNLRGVINDNTLDGKRGRVLELINREKEEVFDHLICFEREITNPNLIKKNMDELVNVLNKMQVGHKNRVITKVIGRDKIKKTVTMRIYIQVNDETKIDKFIEKYPMYKYVDKFIIEKGYLISISNSMEEFKQAVELFMNEVKHDNNGLDNYDVSNNSVIEVSRIGYDGTVLGFDLYMEIK